jgi:hypothetical protein
MAYSQPIHLGSADLPTVQAFLDRYFGAGNSTIKRVSYHYISFPVVIVKTDDGEDILNVNWRPKPQTLMTGRVANLDTDGPSPG